MMKALNTAATGMSAQETYVNTISDNIANVNTNGFKKGTVEFEDLLYETLSSPGARSSGDSRYAVGVQIGSGTKVAAIRKEFTQGSPVNTNSPFDLMINGDGFFGVVMPDNELRYTRDGAFQVDASGILVTRNGYKVFPTITFPPNTSTVNISDNGTVEGFVKNQKEPIGLGQIPIFTFINPVGLKSAGENLYQISMSSGDPIQRVAGEDNAGILMQGYIEASNINIVNEMTSLIRAQRAYETNSKVMKVADEMLQTVNNIRN
jgi:flagellar basal-body rod protein FlgG